MATNQNEKVEEKTVETAQEVESFFTKEETYRWLAKYPQHTIPGVLKRLGYDENTERFPVNIVEKAEKIYESMGIAVETQKQLAESMGSANQDTQIVAQQTTAIAVEIMEAQGITFPVEELFVLAQAAVQDGKEIARSLKELRKAGFVAEAQSGNAEFVQEVLNVMGIGSSVIDQVFSKENIQVLVEDAVPQIAAPDIQAFRTQLEKRREERKQLDAAKQQQRAALPRPKVDVKGYLAARSARS